MNGEGSQYSGLSVLWYQQGGPEMGQAQVKLVVIVEAWVVVGSRSWSWS